MKLEVLGTKRKWCYTSPNTIKTCQFITNSDLGEVKSDQGKNKINKSKIFTEKRDKSLQQLGWSLQVANKRGGARREKFQKEERIEYKTIN